jgi:TP901 family phage tail tape measure protein
MREQSRSAQGLRQALTTLATQLDRSGKAATANAAAFQSIRTQMSAWRVVMGQLNSTMQRLNQHFHSQTTQVGALERKLIDVERRLRLLQQQMNTAAAATTKQATATTLLSRALEILLLSLRRVLISLTTFYLGYQSLTLLGEGFRQIISYEAKLIGVGKTTNLMGQELSRLGENLVELSLTGQASAETLLEVAKAAGQIGVSGASNLEAFADTLSQLETATDISGEQGATSLARLLNVVGESASEIKVLGAVLTELGNTSAATESEIAFVATGIGQATAMFRVSSAEAAALGATFAELGVHAELASSTTLRLMLALDQAIRRNGEELEVLSDLLGQTGEQLEAAFAEAPVKVMRDFLASLNQVQLSGGDVVAVMEQLGLEGVRVNRVLPTLVSAIGNLDKNLNSAYTQLDKGNALLIENERYLRSAEAAWKRLKAAFAAASLEGKGLAAVFREVLDFGSSLIVALFNIENSTIRAGTGAKVLADGIRLVAVAAALTSIYLIGGALVDIVTGAGRAGAAMRVLGGILLGHPILTFAVVLAGIAIAFRRWRTEMEQVDVALNELGKSTVQFVEAALKTLEIQASLRELGDGDVAGRDKLINDVKVLADDLRRTLKIEAEVSLSTEGAARTLEAFEQRVANEGGTFGVTTRGRQEAFRTPDGFLALKGAEDVVNRMFPSELFGGDASKRLEAFRQKPILERQLANIKKAMEERGGGNALLDRANEQLRRDTQAQLDVIRQAIETGDFSKFQPQPGLGNTAGEFGLGGTEVIRVGTDKPSALTGGEFMQRQMGSRLTLAGGDKISPLIEKSAFAEFLAYQSAQADRLLKDSENQQRAEAELRQFINQPVNKLREIRGEFVQMAGEGNDSVIRQLQSALSQEIDSLAKQTTTGGAGANMGTFSLPIDQAQRQAAANLALQIKQLREGGVVDEADAAKAREEMNELFENLKIAVETTGLDEEEKAVLDIRRQVEALRKAEGKQANQVELTVAEGLVRQQYARARAIEQQTKAQEDLNEANTLIGDTNRDLDRQIALMYMSKEVREDQLKLMEYEDELRSKNLTEKQIDKEVAALAKRLEMARAMRQAEEAVGDLIERHSQQLQRDAKLLGRAAHDLKQLSMDLDVQTQSLGATPEQAERLQFKRQVDERLQPLREQPKFIQQSIEETQKALEGGIPNLTPQGRLSLTRHLMELQYELQLTDEELRNAEKGADVLMKKFEEYQQLERIVGIASEIGNAFSAAFADIVFGAKDGKEAMRDFYEFVARLAFQQLVGIPLANALTTGISGVLARATGVGKNKPASGGGVLPIPFAAGGAMSNMPSLYTNKVYDKPTLFSMQGGRLGIMGEAGPEAVMPLERTKDGLAVRMYGMGGKTDYLPLTRKAGMLGVEMPKSNILRSWADTQKQVLETSEFMTAVDPIKQYAKGGIFGESIKEYMRRANSDKPAVENAGPELTQTALEALTRSTTPDKSVQRQLHTSKQQPTKTTIQNVNLHVHGVRNVDEFRRSEKQISRRIKNMSSK